MIGRLRPGTVVFVSVTGGLGGPARSLSTVLTHLGDSVHRVLFCPPGALADVAVSQGSADAWIRMPTGRQARRAWRVVAGLRLLLLVLANRRGITAVHANGQAELNVVGPAAATARVPVVLWAHASQLSPSTRLLGRLWTRLLGDLRLAAVSPEAGIVLEASGLVGQGSEVVTIPNPIDPTQVVASTTRPHDMINVGYLKGKSPTAGWTMLPDVIEALYDLSVRWLLFTSPPSGSSPADVEQAWQRLRPMVGTRVEMRGKTASVADAYAECDIVFIPSLEESFGRIAVEAMMNGIPVVASDIPALHRLLGNGEAALLFPAGDASAAAERIRLLVGDPALRRRLAERGPARTAHFVPGPIVEQLRDLYLQNRTGRTNRQMHSVPTTRTRATE